MVTPDLSTHRHLVSQFAGSPVLVVGDVVLDRWLSGPAKRLGREAPVPVVSVDHAEETPGGAGNTAANLAALGADVRLVAAVGDDPVGHALRRALRARGVSDEYLVEIPGRTTPAKNRLLTGGQVVARYDQEQDGPLPGSAGAALAGRIEAAGDGCAAVVVCDYGLGTADKAVAAAVARVDGVPLIVDAHDVSAWRGHRATAVVPSFAEAQRLLAGGPAVRPEDATPFRNTDPSAFKRPEPPAYGRPGHRGAGGTRRDRIAYVSENADAVLDACGADMAVVTLDAEGSLLLRRGADPHRTYCTPAPELSAVGAGDTFTAAFALGLACGGPPEAAADIAQCAAAVVVLRAGTAVCSRRDLLRELRAAEGPVVPPEELARRVDAHRAGGARVVFTNGCFDVLHAGHVSYLEEARRLGDVLVVAVNSDASVARLKGPERPINPVEDRAAVLAALGCVDYVTVFEDDSPVRVLEMVRPDVYVKGGDYTPQMLPETPVVERLGGEVRIVEYVQDRSTTSIIERIRTR
ncbi:D-glycero-beta-D-manno-heptose 1-phosphate adenylyltransferase [Bailinhaonella thermotolerans]|uniref:Bifunctional protein HldE n=1 Tax=Bailinhaonella thermotolerans TaxID=1070861 RepID=A0A3A4B9U1_9ACTN|nr:D-glycero-beta-D-manno-heptose 1-phosphate adenylyltransferase [Bailinhaonella thermotolerans]RJL34494.1 D-glycero-beta-D-manno-heptose 1-phosphate adenylyltransferase [Bailinhaonella thermotolerans]